MILYRGHVVVAVKPDGLVHPVTRKPLTEALVIAADGNFRDHEGGRRRTYNCKPLVIETVSERAAKGKRSLLAIVGLYPPDPAPPKLRLALG